MSVESNKYILIAGLPRSGSTLVQSILNQSDATFTLPETHFFDEAKKITGNSNLTVNQACELLEILKDKWHLSTQHLRDSLNRQLPDTLLEPSELYFQLIDQYRPANGNFTIGIEKTPGNLFAMDELLNQRCNFKVILTSRNFIDFASSLSKQFWSPDSTVKISYLWNESMRKIHELQRKYPTRITTLDYSDMITRPNTVFKNVYTFCGLDWHAGILSDINSKTDDFIIPIERSWKADNLSHTGVNNSVKKCTLSLKQRLLLHRECINAALDVGYIRHYKF